MSKWLDDKVMDQLHFHSLKPAGVSLLKIQPEGISVTNSLVEWLQHRILSEDISTEKKC